MRSLFSALFAVLLSSLAFSTAVGDEELIYTVQPGDTLEKVVKEYGVQSLQVEELRHFNKLGTTRSLPPGTRIHFRLGWLKVKPLEVHVQAVSGPVMVTRAGGQSAEKIEMGDGFKPGDVLETGKGGSVMLQFGDGSRLLLQGDSILIFEVLEKYGDPDVPNIRLHLRRGRIETEVAPNDSPDRRFEIRTPAGSAGARGTRFRVGTDDTVQQLRTEVTHGLVAVEGGGEELPVAERFGTVVEAGRPPVPPLPLLPAPDLSALEPLYRHLPLRIGWEGQPGAVGYRVQIAPVAGGGVVVVDQHVSTSETEIGELGDGEYQLIVRATDSHGLEGLDARHRFVLDAHPLPPRLVAPVGGERVRHLRPVFRWHPSADARDYRFQLDSSQEFETPLMDVQIPAGTSYRLSEALVPGRYYWRMASRDRKGELGLFGEVFQFEIALPPEPPRDISIRKTADQLRLQWPQEKAGHRYQLQLAEDRAFSRVTTRRETAQTELVLPRPQQKVYMRMRTLDSDGFPGPFSTPIEIVPPLKNQIPLFILGTAGLVFLL